MDMEQEAVFFSQGDSASPHFQKWVWGCRALVSLPLAITDMMIVTINSKEMFKSKQVTECFMSKLLCDHKESSQ